MKITGSEIIRATGVAAIAAGIIFAAIQPIHPADELASVTTGFWTVIIVLKFVTCFLFLIAIAGLYARQVEEVGWLGLAGALLFSLCWMLQIGFVFTELFVLPLMASAAPSFVDSFLGVVNGSPGDMAIGALGPVYGFLGILYLLGGLCLGIATFRAGVLPRWPAGLLAVTAFLTPLAALLPHEIQRLAAVPMGVSFAWLGYALWAERRVDVSEGSPTATSMRAHRNGLGLLASLGDLPRLPMPTHLLRNHPAPSTRIVPNNC